MSPVLQTAAGTSSSDCPLSPVNERYCLRWLLLTEFNTRASNLIPAAQGTCVAKPGCRLGAPSHAPLRGDTEPPRTHHTLGCPRHGPWAGVSSPHLVFGSSLKGRLESAICFHKKQSSAARLKNGGKKHIFPLFPSLSSDTTPRHNSHSDKA